MTRPACAPRAIRMAISPVRREMPYDSTPYRPMAASVERDAAKHHGKLRRRAILRRQGRELLFERAGGHDGQSRVHALDRLARHRHHRRSVAGGSNQEGRALHRIERLVARHEVARRDGVAQGSEYGRRSLRRPPDRTSGFHRHQLRATRMPMGFRRSKKRLAKASLMTHTFVASPRSLSRMSRPRRIGMPSVEK